MTEFPDWTDNVRADRVSVQRLNSDAERYRINPGPNLPPIDTCPCCGKGLPSVRAAKLVADGYIPMAR